MMFRFLHLSNVKNISNLIIIVHGLRALIIYYCWAIFHLQIIWHIELILKSCFAGAEKVFGDPINLWIIICHFKYSNRLLFRQYKIFVSSLRIKAEINMNSICWYWIRYKMNKNTNEDIDRNPIKIFLYFVFLYWLWHSTKFPFTYLSLIEIFKCYCQHSDSHYSM